MQIKLFEIRDKMTFIPAIAIEMEPPKSEKERFLLGRAGYGGVHCILFGRCDGGRFHHDPFEWQHSQTMFVAHRAIEDRWDQLESGDVIDVEYELGHSAKPKESELYA